jgi:hypothetical protein
MFLVQIPWVIASHRSTPVGLNLRRTPQLPASMISVVDQFPTNIIVVIAAIAAMGGKYLLTLESKKMPLTKKWRGEHSTPFPVGAGGLI